MSVPEIVANLAQGWNRSPAGVALGSDRSGVSAALWTHDKNDVQEVYAAEPNQTHHIISVLQSTLFADVRKDGRPAFAKVVERGSISLMRAGVRPHAIHHGRWSILHLYVPVELVAEIVESADRAVLPSAVELIDPECAPDSAIERIGREVLAEIRSDQPLSRLRIDALGQDLVVQLLRGHSNLCGTRALAREPARGGLAPWHVKKVTDYVDDQLAADVSLADLAALTGLSTFHLCRAFKQSTGLPPHRWRLARRVERAREMLENTDLPIIEVAAAVGYDDPGQLATVFRKALGMTPTQYRRERRS